MSSTHHSHPEPDASGTSSSKPWFPLRREPDSITIQRSRSPSEPSTSSSSSYDSQVSSHASAPESDDEVEEIVPIALRHGVTDLQFLSVVSRDSGHSLFGVISRFCTRRGERIEQWEHGIESRIRSTARLDLEGSHDTLLRVLDRLERGEFLALYNPSSQLIDRINPEFHCSRCILLGRAKDACRGPLPAPIEPSLRLLSPQCAVLDLVLPGKLYKDAHDPNLPTLTLEDFNSTVSLISSKYCELYERRTDEAVSWEVDMHERYAALCGHVDSPRIRWNLIVAAERVRTGQKLPNVDNLFEKTLKAPQNVDPSNKCFVYPRRPPSGVGVRHVSRIGDVRREVRGGGHQLRIL